ncbi:MAG: penicillin-binding protein 2 [Chloroflexi bacterium]|nr:penicillin-binding protein 2 [Chloroflexota bacterium]
MLRQAQERPILRLRILQIVLAVIILILAARLLDLQALRPERYQASENVPTESSRGPLGAILEKNGRLLAADFFMWRVEADPTAFQSKDGNQEEREKQRVALCLAEILDMPAGEILNSLRQDGLYVVVHPEVSMEIAEEIERRSQEETSSDEEEDPATAGCRWTSEQVWTSAYRLRFYPQGEFLAHLLGFVTRVGDSYYGVGEKYHEFLQGGTGALLRRQGAYTLPADFSIYLLSEAKHNLILTTDRGIQFVIERALAKAVEDTGAEGGSIIVMDPATGALLGSASYPEYDPNEYWKYSDDNPAIFNDPTISLVYEPGSVFKIITIAAGLDSGAVTPDSVFDDPGQLEAGGHVFQNADRMPHGEVTVTEILVFSFNVGVAQVGEEMGVETFYKYVARFGFGRKTGVDLAHEVDGLVKHPGSQYWSISDLPANSFGQGISVTPLQMLTAVAAVANGGMLMQPHVVDTLVEDGRAMKVPPVAVAQVIKPETARLLTEMLVTVVEQGIPEARIEGYRVAGKTGTAQVPVEGKYHEEWTIASFAGFAPADDPAFACLIKLDKPKTSPWGTRVAAPVFREIAPQILRILQVPPDAERLSNKGD